MILKNNHSSRTFAQAHTKWQTILGRDYSLEDSAVLLQTHDQVLQEYHLKYLYLKILHEWYWTPRKSFYPIDVVGGAPQEIVFKQARLGSSIYLDWTAAIEHNKQGVQID